jgi:hypothetical protein
VKKMRMRNNVIKRKNTLVFLMSIFVVSLFIGTSMTSAVADDSLSIYSTMTIVEKRLAEEESELAADNSVEELSSPLTTEEEDKPEIISEEVKAPEEVVEEEVVIVPAEEEKVLIEVVEEEKTETAYVITEVVEEEAQCPLCGEESDSDEIGLGFDYNSLSSSEKSQLSESLQLFASNAEGIEQISRMSKSEYIDLLKWGKSEIMGYADEIQDSDMKESFAKVAMMLQNEIALFELSNGVGLVYAKDLSEVDDSKPDLSRMPQDGEDGPIWHIDPEDDEDPKPKEPCDRELFKECVENALNSLNGIWEEIKLTPAYQALSAAAKQALNNFIDFVATHPTLRKMGILGTLGRAFGNIGEFFDNYILPIKQVLNYIGVGKTNDPSFGLKMKLLSFALNAMKWGIPASIILVNFGDDILNAWRQFKNSELYDNIVAGIGNVFGFIGDGLRAIGSAVMDTLELARDICEYLLDCIDPNGNGSSCFLSGTMVPTFNNLPDNFLTGGFSSSLSADSAGSGSSISNNDIVKIGENINTGEPYNSGGSTESSDSSLSGAEDKSIENYVQIKNIEDVKVGDKVLSYDQKQGTIVLSTVTNALHHKADEMTEYYLSITLTKDGEILEKPLEVTPNHYLSVQSTYDNGDFKSPDESASTSTAELNQASESKGEFEFKLAGELKEGDLVMGCKVRSIERVYERVETYDLEVQGLSGEDVDNYAILADIPDIFKSDSLESSMMSGTPSAGNLQIAQNEPGVVAVISVRMMVRLDPTAFATKTNPAAAATTTETASTTTSSSTVTNVMQMQMQTTTTTITTGKTTGSTSL